MTKIEFNQHREAYQERCELYDKDIPWIKDELAKLKKAVDSLAELSRLKDELASILKRIQDLENALREKVDLEFFEEQINYLKSLFANIGK